MRAYVTGIPLVEADFLAFKQDKLCGTQLGYWEGGGGEILSIDKVV